MIMKQKSEDSMLDKQTVLGSKWIGSIPKPFFIMDWLESINPKDLELAQKMLKTPQKARCNNSSDPEDLTTVSTNLFSSDPLPPLPPGSKRSPSRVSFLKQRSIAIGNGWNAKGLQKAKNGKWEDALACWENALEIRKQVLGETHLDVANTCNNMGIALGKLNRFEEALEVLQCSLTIRTDHYGKEHTEVASTLHNIGNILHQAGDLSGAIDCFFKARDIQEKVLGPEHIQVARACVAMGHTYYHANDFQDAREAYKDALIIFRKSGCSASHPEVICVVQDLKHLEAV